MGVCTHASSPLQPGLENFYPESVIRGTVVFGPQLSKGNGNAIVVALGAGVSAVTLLFVVDGSWSDHSLNGAPFAADVVRHSEVSDGITDRNPDLIARLEERLIAICRDDVRHYSLSASD